jgi:hypothetical protein
MVNLKYTLFDLFVYTLPGAFFLFCFCCIGSFNPMYPASMLNGEIFDRKVSIFQGTMFIIVAYVIGFIFSILGNFILKIIKGIKKLIEEPRMKISNSVKYVIVREKSPENKKYVEQWNALKNLSCSLAIVFLFIAINFKVKFENFHTFFFILTLCISIFLLIKATEYGRWAKMDLDNAYEKFKD